ncbi:MAG: hypothetical protein L0Z52_04465 [Acidobacteria bacterium]|nr:hypothetical protein [Acidobacteriota bacterium]
MVQPPIAQSDATPPILAEFSFSPTSIDTSASSQAVLVTFHVTDDLSGVASVRATFSNRDVPSDPLGCESTAPDSGTSLDGIYTCTVNFPQFSTPGTWQVFVVELVDATSNQALLTTAALFGMGFPTDLLVSTDPDTTPPALAGFNFVPRALDAAPGSGSVQVTFHVTDNQSGVAWAKVTFMGPGPGGAVLGCTALTVSPGEEPALDVVLSCNAVFPQFSAQGIWTVFGVELEDVAGNNHQTSAGELPGLGFPSELNLTSQQDITAPTLVTFSFAPTAIDTQAGAATVQVNFTASDDLAGVASVRAVFNSPGTQPQTRECLSAFPDSSPALQGTYHCVLLFPAHSPEGLWQVSQVEVIDAANHSHVYPMAELAGSGFPVNLSVGFAPGPPRAVLEVPQTGRSVHGDSLTVGANLIQGGPSSVSPSLGVVLEYRPLPFGSFAPIPPKDAFQSNPDTTYPYFIHWNLTSVPNGDYELRAVARDTSGVPDPAPGTIMVHVTDGASAEVDESVNAQGRQESRVLVVGTEVGTVVSGDRAPKGEMTRWEIPVGSLDLPTDAMKALYPDPAGELPRLEQPEQSIDVFVDLSLESGQSNFPPGLPAELEISYPDADQDGVVDGRAIREEDLELLRLDTSSNRYVKMPSWVVLTEHNRIHAVLSQTGRFAVTGPVEAKVRFLPDGVTLAWDPLAEASSYHVYRGSLALLRDTNGDGLPDAGYGDCRDFLDPVLTDTQYIDAEAPGGTGSGFFYLVTIQAPSGEYGLGTTSQGLLRTPALTCP